MKIDTTKNPTPLSARSRLAVRAGILASTLSKLLGRGEGSVIGGRVALLVDPNVLQQLATARTVVLVSGTNGKTTTTSLLVAALETVGPVATNGAGANMYGGMAIALAQSDARVAVLEVDEGHLPTTLATTHAQLVVLLNLSRDQLDRVGEVRMQAAKWRDALTNAETTVVANADDPLVVWAASIAKSVVWVSVGSAWRLDATSCPNCGSRIDWNDQDWSCSSCELRRPQTPTRLGNDVLEHDGLVVPLKLALPGRVNQGNAVFAVVAASLLGADVRTAVAAVAQSSGAGGRFTTVRISGVDTRLILAKNPAGWAEALTIAKSDDEPLVVSINARVQDGKDPSWLWDVPFEQLRGRFVVATGDRGRDLAVRLRYADVEHVFVENLTYAITRASSRAASAATIDMIGNYSAFQDYRKLATS